MAAGHLDTVLPIDDMSLGSTPSKQSLLVPPTNTKLPSALAAIAAKNAKKQKTEEAKLKSAFLTEFDHTHGHHHGGSGKDNHAKDGKDRAVTPNTKAKQEKNVRGKATKVIDNSNSWLELEARHMFVACNGDKRTPQMSTTKNFNAHNDSIPILVPMNGNSCFTTVSHDGYEW